MLASSVSQIIDFTIEVLDLQLLDNQKQSYLRTSLPQEYNTQISNAEHYDLVVLQLHPVVRVSVGTHGVVKLYVGIV